jgi:hypothetical protein
VPLRRLAKYESACGLPGGAIDTNRGTVRDRARALIQRVGQENVARGSILAKTREWLGIEPRPKVGTIPGTDQEAKVPNVCCCGMLFGGTPAAESLMIVWKDSGVPPMRNISH